ncbi:MAG: hypothetical protein EB084_05815 [Proteobacteria bacterium]|nr:hypothetical protein [Pseudomonadota bacterium]
MFPICLSLMFCLFVLALALAEQSRAHLGFTLQAEAETRGTEAGLAALVELTSVLQHSVDPQRFTADLAPGKMGLPDPVPASGQGGALPFHGTDFFDVSVVGEFGGGATDASWHRPPPTVYDAQASDGYLAPVVTPAGVAVPARHTLLQAQATLPGLGLTRSLAMISSNHPYGLFAPNGSVAVAEARTTGDWTGSTETGLMASIVALSGITVTGTANARMYTARGLGQGVRASQGLKCVITTPITSPPDYDPSLTKAQSDAMSGLTDKGSDVAHLHDCRHQSIPDSNDITTSCQRGNVVKQFNPGDTDIATIVGLAGTDLTGSGSSAVFQIASADLVVPSGKYVSLPYTVDIQGSLVITGPAELYVSNDLRVHGDVRLGPRATLIVGGALQVDGRIDMLYAPGTNPTITSCVLVQGDATVQHGMMGHENGVTLTAATPFSRPDCPFAPSTLTCVVPGRPPSIHFEQAHNPNCDTFDKIAAGCADTNNTAWAEFFPVVKLNGPADLSNEAGVFISCGGTLSVGSDASESAAGFLVADHDISLGVGRFVGTAWSRSGNINAPTTVWRWYPFYSHAWLQSQGRLNPVTANRYWRVGYGVVR